MKYTVAPVIRPLGGRTGFYRIVGIGDGVLLTEAEARIAAFALNAVADGHVLRARSMRWNALQHAYETFDYDGPTEGVAP
jgi:hypothetical protein